jgi:arginine utilization regulatory protein
METIEKQIIADEMIKFNGNISKAADALKIKRQTLQHKLKKYGIK